MVELFQLIYVSKVALEGVGGDYAELCHADINEHSAVLSRLACTRRDTL